jgi:NADH-quinone oxidoreductase subunit N
MHSVNFFSPFFLGVIAVITTFIGVFLKHKLAKSFAIVVCIITIILSFVPTNGIVLQAIETNTLSFSIIIGLLSQIIIAIASISSVVIIANDKRENITRFESYPLILLAFSGGLFAIFANNILGTYLGIELTSIAGYILASLNRENPKSNESSMKYFLMGAISSCIIVYGISLVYGFSGGDLDLIQLEGSGKENALGLTIGFLLIILGLLFKTTTFPFHFWASDVYSGINSSSLSFIAIVPKLVAFVVMTKIVIFKFVQIEVGFDAFTKVASVFAGVSMLIGAFGALRQTSIKRILAYSGISHMGFVFALFGAKLVSPLLIMYYFFVYVFINMGIFATISALSKNIKYTGEVEDLKGLSNSNPRLALVFSAFMLSSAGIPPLAGFFIKYAVLSSLINNGLVVLAIVGILSSAVSSFYYLKIIKAMYFDKQDEEFAQYSNNNIGRSITFLIALSLIFNVVFVALANFVFLI